MDEHDKALLEQAKNTSRWHCMDIKELIKQAHSEQARELLTIEFWDKFDLMNESL